MMRILVTEFRKVVANRLHEWFGACVMAAWGVVLLLPSSTFGTGSVWAGFATVASEPYLGLFMLVMGVVRLGVLAVNGFWRPMYYIRAVLAFVSCAIWTTLSLGFWSSGTVSTWIAVYPIMAAFCGVNCYLAAGDAAAMEVQRRTKTVGGPAHVHTSA